MLIDQATIFVRSGKGGDGCVSLRREKYIPKGGPDGGDGGRGGDVVLVATDSLSTLLPLTPRPHYRAKNGEAGMGRSKHGADGADCVVQVPVGTLVYDKETGDLLIDMAEDGQQFIAARGGRGGFGNEHFKSATNQTPREATPGEPWEERTLLLELKLIADVGLIGMPNAGKSTLLSAVSRARPRIADYPFTTLAPHLGIAELPGERRLVLADIPGLIEGASEGAGLGHAFLRHIERTTILVHVLDVAPVDGSDPATNYRTIRAELQRYSADFAEKREVIAFNKIDLIPESERAAFVADLSTQIGCPPGAALALSGATGIGVPEVLEACWVATERSTSGWAAPSAS